jgi:hypothetical protein
VPSLSTLYYRIRFDVLEGKKKLTTRSTRRTLEPRHRATLAVSRTEPATSCSAARNRIERETDCGMSYGHSGRESKLFGMRPSALVLRYSRLS